MLSSGKQSVEPFHGPDVAELIFGVLGKYASVFALSSTGNWNYLFSTWGPAITSFSQIETNQWHHLAITMKEDRGHPLSTLYFDGEYQTEKYLDVDAAQSSVIYFDGLPKDIENLKQLDGELPDMLVYDVALSASNIKYIYARRR